MERLHHSHTPLSLLVFVEIVALCSSLAIGLMVYLRRSGELTPDEGLYMSVAVSSFLIGLFRVVVLATWSFSWRLRMEFLLSGCYLGLLWATMHTVLRFAGRQRPHFETVSCTIDRARHC